MKLIMNVGLWVIVSAFFNSQADAQITYDYARGIGSSSAVITDAANGIAVDASGNAFVVGEFSGTNVEFNPGGTSMLLSSNASSADIFLGKYDATGVITSTANIFRKGNSDVDRATKVYVDASNNVYVVGSFFNTTQFGSSFLGNLSGNSGRAFVAKYDNNLGFQWAIAIGDAAISFGAKVNDVAVDGSGNVFITGQFQSTTTVDFNLGPQAPVASTAGPGADPGPYTPITASSNGSTDIFVAKYNSGGLCQWVKTAGGTFGDEGLAVDYDNTGNVYVTGSFVGQTINFGPGVDLSEVGGGATGDIFVAKYSSAGTLVGAFNIGNALAEKSYGIAVEKSTGDFAITGYFLKDGIPIDFDPSGATANETGVTQKDMFVAKYSSALAYQWHKAVGSTLDDQGNAVKLAGSNVIVTGGYSGTNTNFGNANTLTSAGGLDAFIAMYSFSTGACISATSIGGASNEAGLALAYGSSKIYVAGYNEGAGDYDPGAGTATLTNAGGKDVFFAKYTDASCVFPTITADPVSASRCVGTSVTFSVTATGAGTITYQWKKGAANIPSANSSIYTIASPVNGNAGNYTCEVTLNGTCTVTSAIAVLTVSNLVTSNAGSAQSLCNATTATLAGNNPAPGTGVWSTIVGSGAASTSNSATSGVTGLTPGASSTFQWTITNGACVSSSTVVITSSSPVTSNAGTAQSVCNATTATLAATVPGVGTGAWTTTAGSGTATTSGSATSGVTGLTIGASSTFQWTVTNGACSANSSVVVTSSSPVTSNAGTAQSVCNATTATLAATVPGVGTGAWTTTAGSGTATTSGSATSGVTGLTIGASSTFQWTVTNGACTANSTVVITSSSPVTSNAGTAQSVCNATTATLAATVPGTGTGAWTTTAGSGTATTSGSATSGVTGLTIGASSTFQWTVTNGACSANSSVVVTSSSPVTSNAGTAQSVCNATTATLAATVPGVGTGAWTTTAGSGTATTSGSATSGVTGLTIGASSTFQWTVTNGACTANSTVVITSSSPVTSNAGSAQSVCNATTATLAATVPSVGSGVWLKTAGSGAVTTASSATSGVTGLTVGASSTFQWTVTNGACSANSSVIITSSSPVTSNAGTAQSVCNATTATLAATIPGVGTGAWSTTAGTGSASSINSATSGVTGLTVGASSTFQWTVTNGACLASSSVVITSSTSVTSNAGSGQSLCNATTATLSATTPSVGTGAWSTTAGTGSASSINSATSGVTGLTVGASSTFQWTVTNGACLASSSVVITSSTPVTSNAGSAQSLCNVSIATLAATVPSVGIGGWIKLSGTGAVTTPSSATSGVTGLTPGTSSTFMWAVSNGACSANSSVVITVSANIVADAGTTQSLCNASFSTLNGNDPAPGSGLWTRTSGVGTISTPISSISNVTGLSAGTTATFQWTITNGACTSSSSVTITNFASAVANAGPAQSLCNVTTADLAAVTPPAGSGLWTKTSGTGSITTPSSNTSGITGLTVGTSSTFLWTVTNGPCTANNSVTITVTTAGTANAGADQVICNSTTTTLAGSGTGTWAKISGSGSVVTPSSATSNVTGLTVGAVSVFEWTVTNGSCSGTAQVSITVSSPVTANAGADQTICNLTTTSLSATTPTIGTGAWAKTAGSGSVTTASSTTSGITGLTVGSSSTFQWTVINGACIANDDVVIISSFPVSSSAGSSQTLCNATDANLSAVSPAIGTGLWTLTSGTGTLAFANIANSSVSGLTVGTSSVFQWTVTNGACSANSSVTITSSSQVTANAGLDQSLCNVTAGTFAATNPSVGVGAWTLTAGTGSATAPSSNISAIAGLSLNTSSTFTWTVTNGACSAADDVTISVVTPALITTDPASQTVCTGSPVSFNGVVSGMGTYKWKKGVGYLSNGGTVSGATTTTLTISTLVAGDAGDYTLEVTNGCGVVNSNPATLTVSTSVLTITAQPTAQANCTGATVMFNVAANGTGVLSYQWKKGGADMSDGGNVNGSSSSTLLLGAVTSADANTYSVSISNSCGTLTSDIVALTIDAAAIITQPVTQNICPGTDATFSIVATGNNLTYQWQKNSGDIPLATGSSLSISGVSFTDEATYLCNVTSCGNTISSTAVDLTLDICTGTYDALTGESILMYPNPAKNELHVNGTINDNLEQITIVNATGDVVYSANNIKAESHDLSVAHLAQGLYIVIIETASNKKIEKLEVVN